MRPGGTNLRDLGDLRCYSQTPHHYYAYSREFAVVIWGLWLLFSVRPSGRLVLVMALILVAVAVHVTTIGDSRHRLGIEFLFFGLAGCEARPFSFRRVWWTGLAATVLGLVGFYSPRLGEALLFGSQSENGVQRHAEQRGSGESRSAYAEAVEQASTALNKHLPTNDGVTPIP